MMDIKQGECYAVKKPLLLVAVFCQMYALCEFRIKCMLFDYFPLLISLSLIGENCQ